MALTFTFHKMSGTGNDFIMIDNRTHFFPVQNNKLITDLCDRRKGIGADGIILIEPSKNNNFRMRIINSDGTEAEMCGNGARCAVLFAHKLGIIQKECTVETLAGELQGSLNENYVRLNMGIPKDLKDPVALSFKESLLEVYFVNTGVPHAVIFVEDIKTVNVFETGRFIRTHDHFKPKGTNCNFVQIVDSSNILVRTYERGVEDETYSCGTGTCASAIISALHKGLQWPITSTTQLGDTLIVDSKIQKGNENQEFYFSGAVNIAYKGERDL